MFLAFGLPAINSGPHHVPIGVTGPKAATDALRSSIGEHGDGAWDVTAYPDAKALTRAVEEREISGGFALGQGSVTVYSAGAAGAQTAAAINSMGSALATGQHAEVTVHDVVPFPEDDSRGAGLTAAALPMIIGGSMPAIALLKLFPGHAGLRIRATGALLFALAAGFAMTAILQFGFGTVDGCYWLTALGMSLGMAALAVPLLGLESLFGFAGLGAGMALVMIVGNPLSGLATGAHWLPDGWSTVGQLLPPGASGSLLRANAYFDGTGAAGPVAVLACWVLAGLVLVLAADRRSRKSATAPDSTAVPAPGTA
ncbi:hypothetical protein AB0467_00105 [Streptomyces sp. NPDC052095]|uniref:hypothetical protein n=1 Tax=unclassified Streptomyces TaxID=2593676 RepID=UPI00344BD046